jgi:hypothetical protein
VTHELKLALAGYLGAAVVMAVYQALRLQKVFARSHMRLKLNSSEAVDLKQMPVMKVLLLCYVLWDGLVWPWALYRLLSRTPREVIQEETSGVELQAAVAVSEDNLPQGDEYVREVKQVHVMLASEVERATSRGYGHRLVVVDVLLQLAYQAAADELNQGVSSEDVDDYVFWSVERVMDGEVDRALSGRGREQKRVRRDSPPAA